MYAVFMVPLYINGWTHKNLYMILIRLIPWKFRAYLRWAKNPHRERTG